MLVLNFDSLTIAGFAVVVAVAITLLVICKLKGCDKPIC
jgi:hypothetical protein